MKNSVWEVPRQALDLGVNFPAPQDADWLFRFDSDGTMSIFLRTPGMAIQTPVRPRWHFDNNTLVLDWTDQLPGPQETHLQLLSNDQNGVTWLRSLGGEQRWTRAEVPANALTAFAHDHETSSPAPPSSSAASSSNGDSFPVGTWRFFLRGPAQAWHVLPNGGRVPMMQITAVNRFVYIHSDGTCRLIIDTQPDGGTRTVENLSGKWTFSSGTITMNFPSATVVMREVGHDSSGAHWVDDQHGGRQENWTVLSEKPEAVDADQDASQITAPPQAALSAQAENSNQGAGPGSDYTLVPDKSLTSPDHRDIVVQFSRLKADRSSDWQFWVNTAGHYAALLPASQNYSAGFRFTNDSQWLVRGQKTGAGEATLFLYRSNPQGFLPASARPLGDLAWDFLKNDPAYGHIESPNFHLVVNLVGGVEQNYSNLGEQWPDSRYLVLALWGDVLPHLGHKQRQSVRGWRCVYDLKAESFNVPSDFLATNAEALATQSDNPASALTNQPAVAESGQSSHIFVTFAVTTGNQETDERIWNALNASQGDLHHQMKEQLEEGHGQLPAEVVSRIVQETQTVEATGSSQDKK